jgi:hypothetical protein
MDSKFDDSGFKKLSKNIKEMKEKVPIEKLFTPMFMKRYTKSYNFEEFVLKSELVNSEKEVTPEEFRAIPDKDWNKYILKNTSFSSWQAMQEKALKEYLTSQLFKGMK